MRLRSSAPDVERVVVEPPGTLGYARTTLRDRTSCSVSVKKASIYNQNPLILGRSSPSGPLSAARPRQNVRPDRAAQCESVCCVAFGFSPSHQVLGIADWECLSVRPGGIIRGVRGPVIREVASRQPASAFEFSMPNPSRSSFAARLDLST